MRPWVEPRLERRERGEKHPVDDFLFDYYPYSPHKLLTWHPGFGVTLEGDAHDFLAYEEYEVVPDGVRVVPGRLVDPHGRLALVLRILAGMSEREAMTGCFGLHEWAMVYGLQQGEVRHSRLPLRLVPDDIRGTVDAMGLRCTHVDAYRFFTPEAVARNAYEPTRAAQPDFDQPGCLHANMDLYKYAMWFSPFVCSDLIADAFELARAARDLDMQASPYDCTAYGLEPIQVETAQGRAEYSRRQREIMAVAEPLRTDLISALSGLNTAIRGLVA